MRRTRRRFDECTLGGNLATSAGGLRCVKYGVTRDVVLGPRGGARRRRGAADRPPHRQGRRRLRPDPADRRQRGHARRHHRGHLGAAARCRSPALTAGRGLPVAATPRCGCRADHGRGPRPPSLEFLDSTASARCRTIATSGCRGMPAPCCSRSRTAVRVPPTTWRRWPAGAPTPERPRRPWPPTRPSPSCCSRRGASSTGGVDALGRPSSRTSASRGPARRPGRWAPAHRRDQHGCHRVRRARRRRQHAPDGGLRPRQPRRSSGGRTRPSATSWSSACGSAARSPASTASACSSATGSPWSCPRRTPRAPRDQARTGPARDPQPRQGP